LGKNQQKTQQKKRIMLHERGCKKNVSKGSFESKIKEVITDLKVIIKMCLGWP